MNAGEAYQRLLKILPADQIPQQMQMVDGLVDLKNVDDVIATFSLRETGVALEANVNFKDGTQSMAYNLIRTPNLNKDSLKAVPAEAIALFSLTLGEAGTATGPGRRRQDQERHRAGPRPPDLRQYRADQRSSPAAEGSRPRRNREHAGPLQSLGLALTSRDPQKTQQLLMTVLQMANLVPSDTQQHVAGFRPVRDRRWPTT